MKIRNGFVSNSSSSSFVVLLPDDFDINTIDFQAEIDKTETWDEPAEPENVKEALSDLLKNKEIYFDDYSDEIEVIENILTPYIIAEFETGPDEGSIALADKDKIKKILNIS